MEESVPVPISISPAQPDERKVSDVRVIEVDLTTTDEMAEKQDRTFVLSSHQEDKHTGYEMNRSCKGNSKKTHWYLSKLFDKSLLAELRSEDE